jgi:hypothetical protein
VPAAASSAEGKDLDGDGSPDTLWLEDRRDDAGLHRFLGVTTGSGATTEVEFSSAAPQAASARAAVVENSSLASIVLLDLGRSVELYALVDCELVPTLNAQGETYTFDRGFTGYGTGVGCEFLRNRLTLVGYLAEDVDGGTQVTRTVVDVNDDGRTASNGPSDVVASSLGPDDEAAQDARAVECDDAPVVRE